MARISTIDEPKARGKSRKATGPLPRPTSLPVTILGIASLLIGAYVHYQAVHNAPDGNGKILLSWNSDQARKHLNLSPSWPGTQFFDNYASRAMNLFMIIVVVFKKICVDDTGRGLLLLVSTCIAPFCTFLAYEGLKDGNSWVLSITVLIAASSLGQMMCIGAAMPLVVGPLYAISRWRDVRSPDTIQPLPSPSTFRVTIATLCSGLALATFFPTLFVPLDSEYWVFWNVLFQFFPIAWIPLLFFPRKKSVISTPASASARQEPRLSAAMGYRATGYLCVIIYYLSLYYGFSGFQRAFEKRGYWANDGHHILFWDGIGCLLFDYIIVLIDSYVDEAKIAKGAPQRTHEKRFLPEDIIMGLPGLFILGPGFAMSAYFQRREILAEKARFGIASKDD